MLSNAETVKPNGDVLTAGEYAALLAANNHIAYSAIIRQYGPAWEFQEDLIRYLPQVDAVVAAEYIVQVYRSTSVWTIERKAIEDESDQAWEEIATITAGSGLVSLASDDEIVYVYYYDGANINVSVCDDISAATPTFDSPDTILATTACDGLGAVSGTRVYWSELNSNNNHVMHVADLDGTWSDAESDVYWPLPFDSFDAVSMGDYDIVAFSGYLPPLWGTRAVGMTVSAVFDSVQGIVTFVVRNGRWADYRVFDQIDKQCKGYSRLDLRMSVGNGYAFITYDRHSIFRKYSATGALLPDDYPGRRVPVITRSRDGFNWEFPELALKPATPFVALTGLGHFYLAALNGAYRSEKCVWAGYDDAESQDITSSTLSIRSQAADIRATEIDLANPFRPVDQSVPSPILEGTLVDSRVRLLLSLYLGYQVGTQWLPVLSSTEDVIKRTRTTSTPRHNMGISCSDVLGRMNRLRVDSAFEWPTQAVGRDPFEDDTGTGYGGLKHIAGIEGQWKASNGVLNLVSSLHRSLAESTMITDTMNGSASVSFTLNDPNQKEYGGIAFRLLDKDYYFFVFYDIESDTIQICKNKTGQADIVYATSSAMNWDTGGVQHHLRVEIRYSIVKVFTSTDGITWTQIVWASGAGELPGMATISSSTKYKMWSGKMGIVGKGYSDDDENEPITTDPYVEPETPPPGTGVSGDATTLWIFEQRACYYSDDFFGGGQPSWHQVAGAMPGTGTLSKAFATMSGAAIILVYGGSYENKGIYVCSNPKDAVPVWTDILVGQKINGNLPLSLSDANWDVGVWQNTLWCAAETSESYFYYATYNGSSWSAWATGIFDWTFSSTNAKNYGIYNKGEQYKTLPVPGVIVTVPNICPGATHWAFAWTLHVTTNYYTGSSKAYLYIPETNTVLTEITDTEVVNYNGQPTSNLIVNGSINGNRVFVINPIAGLHNGEIWIGNYASGVSLKHTWPLAQRVHDSKKAGGGALVVTKSACLGNNEFARIARDGVGTTWESMTGDFWTLTSGTQNFVNSSVVYA